VGGLLGNAEAGDDWPRTSQLAELAELKTRLSLDS
jgi:hypothetical protein